MLATAHSFFSQSREETASTSTVVDSASTSLPSLLAQQSLSPLADDYESDDIDCTSETAAFNREESLKRMLANRNRVCDIRKSLKDIVGAMGENPSFFSKLSRSWGGMGWTSKIGTGVAIALIPGAGSIFITINSVIAIAASLGGAYAGIGFILEDHFQSTENMTEQLEKGISGIVNILDKIVSELDQLRHDFSIELDRLAEENGKLTDNNAMFKVNNEALEHTLESQKELATKLESEISALAKVRSDLEAHGKNLKSDDSIDNEAIRLNQERILNNQKQYSLQLGEYAALLNEVSAKQLASESQSAQAKLKEKEVQQVMVELFKTQANATEPEKDAFKLNLEMFMNGSGLSFNRLQSNLETLEADREKLLDQLREQALEYAKLNKQHTLIVAKLDSIMNSDLAKEMANTLVNSVQNQSDSAGLLSQLGSFSQKNMPWSAHDNSISACDTLAI